MRKKYSSIAFITVLLFSGYTSLSLGQTSLPQGKQTTLGLYVTAKEAYVKWLSDPANVKIIDCRTPEEYIFVGHAPMAYNIPSKFITHKFDENKKRFIMEVNPNFVTLVKAKFETTDTIMIMCISGGRSAKSVNKLAESGFENVYTITDGFEGELVNDPEKVAFYGKRFKNGWKNAGNPWTYEIDPNVVYVAETKKE